MWPTLFPNRPLLVGWIPDDVCGSHFGFQGLSPTILGFGSRIKFFCSIDDPKLHVRSIIWECLTIHWVLHHPLSPSWVLDNSWPSVESFCGSDADLTQRLGAWKFLAWHDTYWRRTQTYSFWHNMTGHVCKMAHDSERICPSSAKSTLSVSVATKHWQSICIDVWHVVNKKGTLHRSSFRSAVPEVVTRRQL